ncbi:MAG: hypothetical protein ACOCYF_02675 [Bacteroidota bacterium]
MSGCVTDQGKVLDSDVCVEKKLEQRQKILIRLGASPRDAYARSRTRKGG